MSSSYSKPAVAMSESEPADTSEISGDQENQPENLPIGDVPLVTASDAAVEKVRFLSSKLLFVTNTFSFLKL